MTRFVGLYVPQKLTAICVIDETGGRLWLGRYATDPGQIERAVRDMRERAPRSASRQAL